jgi:hypothetical protein
VSNFTTVATLPEGTVVKMSGQEWTVRGERDGKRVLAGITRRTLRYVSGDTVVEVVR